MCEFSVPLFICHSVHGCGYLNTGHFSSKIVSIVSYDPESNKWRYGSRKKICRYRLGEAEYTMVIVTKNRKMRIHQGKTSIQERQALGGKLEKNDKVIFKWETWYSRYPYSCMDGLSDFPETIHSILSKHPCKISDRSPIDYALCANTIFSYPIANSFL